MSDFCLTIKQLNDYVSGIISENPLLKKLQIQGEISGFKKYHSGHCYFTLKDSEAQISCVMYKYNADGLDFTPKDGMLVILTGNATLYAAKGQYQFITTKIEKAGEGLLYKQFIDMRNKLEAEGLFAQEHKIDIPMLPRCIGVATSRSGAVYHDICDVAQRRFPNMPIKLEHCAVQGVDAAHEIVSAIEKLDSSKAVDVIIVGRGGGSIEDLFVFNDESVARAIYACKTPIISAVGHEVDYTIADYVADLRAPTPSAAAEIAVPRYSDLSESLATAYSSILHSATSYIEMRYEELRYSAQACKLERIAEKLKMRQDMLSAVEKNMRSNVSHTLSIAKQSLALSETKLLSLSPNAVLSRGYAFVTNANGDFITKGMQLDAHDIVTVHFSDCNKSAEILD